MTPRSTYQRLLAWTGWLLVILILGFLILPAAVVTNNETGVTLSGTFSGSFSGIFGTRS